MKSTLNAKGIYVNCKITEIPKDDTHKVFVKVANCEDGYRCTIGWEWGMWSVGHPIMQDNEVYPTEKDAIRNELNKAMKGIIDQHGVREHATMLYFM